MTLPKSVLGTRKVTLSGGEVEVRTLTYTEVRELKGDGANARAIAGACDVTLEDAQAWIDTATTKDMEALLDVIMDMSGLSEAAQFPVGPADVPESPRPGE